MHVGRRGRAAGNAGDHLVARKLAHRLVDTHANARNKFFHAPIERCDAFVHRGKFFGFGSEFSPRRIKLFSHFAESLFLHGIYAFALFLDLRFEHIVASYQLVFFGAIFADFCVMLLFAASICFFTSSVLSTVSMII